jgi:hypothetical protein
VSGKEEENTGNRQGFTVRKKTSRDKIITRGIITPRIVSPGEDKVKIESSSGELTSEESEEKPVNEPYSVLKNQSPPQIQYVDLIPFRTQGIKQTFEPLLQQSKYINLNKETEERQESERKLYYSTEVNTTTDEEVVQTEPILTTIQEESVEPIENRYQTPPLQKVKNLQGKSSVNTPVSSSESGNNAGSEKSSGDSETNKEELFTTNFGEGSGSTKLNNPFEDSGGLLTPFARKLSQARTRVTKLRNTEGEQSVRLRRTLSTESNLSINEDDGDLLNEYISSCNLSYEAAKGIWDRFTENPTRENWSFLYDEVTLEHKLQSRIQEELEEEDIVSQFEQELEEAKNDDSEVDRTDIRNRDYLYKFSDDSDTPSEGEEDSNQIEETVRNRLREHKRKSKELQDIIDKLETENSEELLEISLSSGSDTGNIFTEVKETIEEAFLSLTNLVEIMSPGNYSSGSGSGSGGTGKIKFETEDKTATIKTTIIDGTPVYEIGKIEPTTDTFKINGLSFFRSETNTNQWYNYIEPNTTYKEEDYEVGIPMALFIGNNFENTTSKELDKLRLEQIRPQAEKYSKVPMQHLTKDKFEIVMEYRRLKEKGMERELAKYKTQKEYNKNQWENKQQKTSSWSWLMGDPLTHETGRTNPELQQTLSLFEEKEEKTLKDVEGMDEEDKKFAKIFEAILNQSNKEEHWVRLPEFNEGDDPFEWLNDYGAACVTNRIVGKRKLEHLATVLRGSANAWWRSIRNEVKEFGRIGSESETFVVRFLDRFAGIENQYEWSRQLAERVQGPRESVRQFADAWKALLRKADPLGTKNELTKVNDFARALRPDLKYDTLIKAPKTLSDTIRQATWVETVRNSTVQGMNTQPYQIEEPTELNERIKNLEQVVTRSYFQKMEEITCNLCNRKGHKAITCPTRTINMERRKQGICFNCNKPGHMAKECNLPKRTTNCENCGKPGHPASRCWGGRNNNNNGNNRYNNNNNYNNRNYNNNNNNNRNNQRSNIPQMQQIRNINGRPTRVFYVEEEEQGENNTSNNNNDINQQLVDIMDQLKRLKSLKA